MFDTTQDILNIAKTVGVIALSFTISFLFWYLAMGAREVFRVFREMRDRMHKLDELIKLAKDKLSNSASNLLLIGKGVEKIAEIAKKFAEKKKSEGADK